MSRIVRLLFLLLIALPAYADWPYIPVRQSNAAAVNAASMNVVMNQNATIGDQIIVGISWFNSTNTPTVSDNCGGNTYTQKFIDTAAANVKVAVYAATETCSTTPTVTVAISGGSFINASVEEFYPVVSLTVDGVGLDTAFTGTPSTVTTPTLTTSINGDLIYTYAGGFQNSGAFEVASTSTSPYMQTTISGGNDSGASAFRIGGVAGANSMTWNNGINSAGTVVIIAFEPSAITITSDANAPVGALSNTYNFTLQAVGGAGAYTWSVSSGSLQSGLSLNSSTGAITGTPSSATTQLITFQVTDGTHTTTKVITLGVASSMNTATFVQGKSASPSSGQNPLAFTSNVTSGNMLVLDVNYNPAAPFPFYCTDTVGSTFRLIYAKIFGDSTTLGPGNGTHGGIYILAGLAHASGADTVTCISNSIANIAEFSNIAYAANDNNITVAGNSAAPATITSGSLTTLVPGEMLLLGCAGFNSGSVLAPNAPFTTVNLTTQPSALGYDAVTTVTGYTGGCNMSVNTNGNWLISLVGLRPASPAPPIITVANANHSHVF